VAARVPPGRGRLTGRSCLLPGVLSHRGVGRGRGAGGRGRGPSAPGQGDPAGHQPEDANDQADDGQGAGRGGVVLGLVALGGQGGVDPGGLAVGPGGQLAAGGLLDRVLDLGGVLDVGEALRPGLDGLVDLLALDGPGEMEGVPNSPTSKNGSIASCSGSAEPVATSTWRVLPRSVTGLSLAPARIS
jgi:hypothetical protein